MSRACSGEVIAGEQRVLPIQQHGVALGVTRDRDREEVVREGHRVAPFQAAFDVAGAPAHVVGMEHPLAPEAFPERLVVRDVVAMRQEEDPRPAQRLDAAQERRRGAR
jgi:hypothetical protein